MRKVKFFYAKFLLGSTLYIGGLTYLYYKSLEDHYKDKTNELRYLRNKLHNSVIILLFFIKFINFLLER